MEVLLQTADMFQLLYFILGGVGTGAVGVFLFGRDIIVVLKKENTELRKKMDDLTKENQDLKLEIEVLRANCMKWEKRLTTVEEKTKRIHKDK